MFFPHQEYETKSGRAGPGNPTSPRQGVRKNLDFEPLSTTALILEDRPAYVNTHAVLDLSAVRLSHIFHAPSQPVESARQTMKPHLLSSYLYLPLIPPLSALLPVSLDSSQYCSSSLCVPVRATDGKREVLLKV